MNFKVQFKKTIVSIFQNTTRFLDYIIPKDHRLVIFGSFGGKYAGGNSKAVFDYLRSLPNNPFKCFFFLLSPSSEPDFISLRPLTLKTYFLYLRAKTQVMTHTLGDMGLLRPSRRKYRIHLWHGHSGPKADGWVSKKYTAKDRINIEKDAPFITKFLITSRINLYLWAYTSVLHPYQMMPLGFPRNDCLLNKERGPPKFPNLLENLDDYNHVILYAPTYRKWAPTKFFPFIDFQEDELEEWLEKNKILLLLRHHINEESSVRESKRVRYFSSEICHDINQILPEVDILVTDYSSIASDYLLLNRPIIYLTVDRDEYEKREGVIFGNYDFWTPGPKVNTFDLFKQTVNDFISGTDDYFEKRQTICELINEYQSENSTEKVSKYLIEFITNGEDATAKYSINFPG